MLLLQYSVHINYNYPQKEYTISYPLQGSILYFFSRLLNPGKS